MNKCVCEKNGTQKILTIEWRRLVEDNKTCSRCGSTENEIAKAVTELKEKLKRKGVEIILKKETLTLEEFKKDPSRSNSISFNGIPLEDLLQAKTGQSKCCGVCGDSECRTVETDNISYEIIPADLIVQAGLKIVNNPKS